MKLTKKTVRVGRSKAGLGLYALKDFKRGDFIIEYTGEHISHAESDNRGGRYLFILNKKVVVDGKGRGNTARYINHGCKGNAEAETDDEDMKIRIHAKRKIGNGEEITYDYGKAYFDEYIKPFGCRCASCMEKKTKSK
jgi:SET domain-containing protein